MIRLIDIFEVIRRRNKMHKKGLALHLGISPISLNTLYKSGNLTNEQVHLFYEYLELGIPTDLAAIYQYHARERLHASLPGIPGRRTIADLIYFSKYIDFTKLHTSILKEILPHILEMPYTLENTRIDIEEHYGNNR